ncbi:MAG: PmoA family protein [Cyclobacteriaceae bacterium]
MMKNKMRLIQKAALTLIIPGLFACGTENKTAVETEEEEEDRIQLVRKDAEKSVEIWIDGKHFTSYIYPEEMEKPVLYPIKTASGKLITRGFPLANRPGERVDHPHHVGMWLNYGDVNGLDFWNNSSAIPEEKKENYGTIIHQTIESVKNGNDSGELVVTADWVNHEGKVLLKEKTQYVFHGQDNKRIIDRITTLTALEEEVSFTDNKEGMIAIRMARELEHPSDKAEKFTDAQGNPTDVPTMNNEGVTGKYLSSEGIEGDDVWGTRGKWMNLAGTIEGEDVSVAILDHPDNIGYPTYWHARGYGLYAANPLGQKAMSEGKEELNHKLAPGESMTFKYRVIVSNGEAVNVDQLNQDFQSFSN